MSVSRRRAIALIGGGVVLAATASAVTFSATRTPNAALAPWKAAGLPDDPRLFALSYAILAPNPHNLQPWVAELVGADTVRIYRDPARALPQTDPFGRQLTIGMGCFVELFRIAASARGFSVETTLFPDGDAPDAPVATLTLTEGAAQDALFAHVLNRRSTKEPYADRAVDPADLAALAPLAQVVTDAPTVEALRALTLDAWMIEATTPQTHRESVELMRFGKAEINASPDGIALGGAFLESLMLAGLLTRAAQRDTTSTAFQAGVDIYTEMLLATRAYVVTTSPTNTRFDQIAAGGQWLRLNLTATARGLSMQPVSQCLQEFPEMAGPYARAHALLAPGGETVQMLGRLGYGPDVPPSPRWPMETRLRNA
ncbi:Acg family FMN-binding oxidoreductase [Roseicitreum antarcticum]|uniref:Nitroreductase family protein n=1 Tax=Roseicitreum antarcticum TaxID=564137 RepID=A0A1H2WFS3_9RHOB|nr:twin-arginine translocation pathway signal protein [Roseicitreum antarcticum]SDW79502.1 hypothetical protein SAMN04488238_103372 [Roseicitreum antarcticum]